jgi:ABC-type transport system substrate-binding protein
MVFERNPYYGGDRTANPDRIVWTIEPDHATRIRATERNENDFTPLVFYSDAVVDDLVERYGLNRPGGQVLRLPTLTNYMFAFNTRSPAFKGRHGAAQEGDQLRARQAGAHRSARLPGSRRTDRALPASLGDKSRLYSIGGPDPITARRWLARAPQRPKTLTLYTANLPYSIANAKVFAANLRQLDIDVRIEYFSFLTRLERLRTKGEPWDVGWIPWSACYADPAGALLPLLSDTRYAGRINAANRVTGTARAKAWSGLEAELMRNDPPVAAYANSTALILLSRSFGCFRWVPGYEFDLAAACKK